MIGVICSTPLWAYNESILFTKKLQKLCKLFNISLLGLEVPYGFWAHKTATTLPLISAVIEPTVNIMLDNNKFQGEK